MKEVGLYEAKTKLSALVAEVEKSGESIMLTRHGKAVAQISPPVQQVVRKAGCLYSPDAFISDDFDDIDMAEDFECLKDWPAPKVAEDETPYETK